MIYSVEGRIVKVDDRFFEKKVKSLTYQYQGSWFPQSYYDANTNSNTTGSNVPEYMRFESTGPNVLTVNYGDGHSVTKDFTLIGNIYVCGVAISTTNFPYAIPQHTYTDGFTGLRNLTFEFLEPDFIEEVDTRFVLLYGSLPKEINEFRNIKSISHSFALYLSSIPDTFPKNLERYAVSRSVIDKLPVIPTALFNTNLELTSATLLYDLSDPISSNFFMISNLKSTLYSCNLSGCNINFLPIELSQCTLLKTLTIENNPIKNPEVLEPLFNLVRLYIDGDFFENGLFETNNLTKLSSFLLQDMTENLINEIPLKWTGLKSLNNFVLFGWVIRTNLLFQSFIENFYTLCTENGFLDTSSTEALNTGFPEQFRDISWGDGYDWFTVTNPIQAPSGFSLGISNGAPANNAEKIYVLIENYGHTVELAP
jgi:hypothetical protein